MQKFDDKRQSFPINKTYSKLLTMENRGHNITKINSIDHFKIYGRIFDLPKRESHWKTGVIDSACEEILALMNIAPFQQISIRKRISLIQRLFEMIASIPTVSKNFILNSAMQEATYILLKPYIADSEAVRLDHVTNRLIEIYSSENHLHDQLSHGLNHPKYFLTKMATVAWDFLNLSNTCQWHH